MCNICHLVDIAHISVFLCGIATCIECKQPSQYVSNKYTFLVSSLCRNGNTLPDRGRDLATVSRLC